MTHTIVGEALALLIGVSLGLIGGGGSILTVPVLVYVMGISPVVSTAYSLFIVGSTSLVGALDYARQKRINFRTAIVFSIPSFIAVYVVRKYVVPAIPDIILTVGSFQMTKNMGLMVLFAVIMLAASVSMIRSKPQVVKEGEIRFNYPLILLEGLIVGAVTGLVGAGGGFLIIPALVLLANLPMKEAVGTSLLIIAAKSLFGFLGDISHLTVDWSLLISFTGLACVGIFIGSWLAGRTDGEKLKQGFGWFVLVMGIYIFVKELFFAA